MKHKKLLSVFLSIVILAITAVPSASAVDIKERQPSIMSYINEVLPKYLAIEYDENYSNIQISQGLTVNGNPDENSKTFFVTNNGDYIGCLAVTSVDGTFHSSFYFDDNLDIATAIDNNDPIALVVNDLGLFMQTSSNIVPLTEIEQPEDELSESSQQFVSTYTETLAEIQLSTYPLSEVVLSNVGFTTADVMLRAANVNSAVASADANNSYTLSLNVPFVANANSPQGAGLCWAACIGAVLRYRVGGSYTATGIYNALASIYSPQTPSGATIWYSRGYQLGGLTATEISSGVNLSTVYAQLNVGKPLLFKVAWYTYDENGVLLSGSHAIVCKYLHSDLSIGTMYGFMDPNFSSTKYISVSYPEASINNSSFVYVGANYTYTVWHGTVY
jgi:hypothetical protein